MRKTAFCFQPVNGSGIKERDNMKRFFNSKTQEFEPVQPCNVYDNSAIEEGYIYEMTGCGHCFSGWMSDPVTWVYCPMCGERHYIKKHRECIKRYSLGRIY